MMPMNEYNDSVPREAMSFSFFYLLSPASSASCRILNLIPMVKEVSKLFRNLLNGTMNSDELVLPHESMFSRKLKSIKHRNTDINPNVLLKLHKLPSAIDLITTVRKLLGGNSHHHRDACSTHE